MNIESKVIPTAAKSPAKQIYPCVKQWKGDGIPVIVRFINLTEGMVLVGNKDKPFGYSLVTWVNATDADWEDFTGTIELTIS